jgi:prepilin-type N-terminal cleavage/methylation domain-containing protein
MVHTPALKNNFAFTLIEILIAVSVMLILTAVTIMLLNPTKLRSDANETKSLSELGTVTNAMEFYYSDKQSYPATLAELVTGNYLADATLLQDETATNYCYLTKGTLVNSYKICTKSTKTIAKKISIELRGYDGVGQCSYAATQKVQCLQSPF